MKFFLSPTDIPTLVRDLSIGLHRLTLWENFEGFLWYGQILAGENLSILNKLVGSGGQKLIPSSYMVLSCDGPPTVCRGDDDWTDSYVSLKNRASTSPVVTLVYFIK